MEKTIETCAVCGGDCSGANPPVIYCPMRDDVQKMEPDGGTSMVASGEVRHA